MVYYAPQDTKWKYLNIFDIIQDLCNKEPMLFVYIFLFTWRIHVFKILK